MSFSQWSLSGPVKASLVWVSTLHYGWGIWKKLRCKPKQWIWSLALALSMILDKFLFQSFDFLFHEKLQQQHFP